MNTLLYKQQEKYVLKFIFALVIIFSVVSCKKNEVVNPPVDTIQKCNGSSELCDKSLPEIAMVMTHNAFNHAERFLVPNQDFTIARQLKDGVRGLMIDVYSSPSGPVVYHGFEALGKESVKISFKEIYDFMKANPNEVIAIIFQNACTDEELIDAMKETDIYQWIYKHNGTWPSLKDMIATNQRIVCMLEVGDGNLPEGLMYAWEYTFDTPYTFASTSEFSSAVNRGGTGKRNFYLINHWLGSSLGTPDRNKAFAANKKEQLLSRIENCESTNGQKMNFLGVDFYNIGSALEVVNEINGIVK